MGHFLSLWLLRPGPFEVVSVSLGTLKKNGNFSFNLVDKKKFVQENINRNFNIFVLLQEQASARQGGLYRQQH